MISIESGSLEIDLSEVFTMNDYVKTNLSLDFRV